MKTFIITVKGQTSDFDYTLRFHENELAGRERPTINQVADAYLNAKGSAYNKAILTLIENGSFSIKEA